MPPALDVLAIGAHPDDVELAMGGALVLLARRRRRVGILDLTRGERGTRGSASIRLRESAASAEVLGVTWRGTAGLPDSRLESNPESRERIADILRQCRPELVLAVASDHRHPDHAAAETLAHDACFIAGLTRAPGRARRAHRPRKFLLASGFRSTAPSLIVDITTVYRKKQRAIRCYRSQFEPGAWRILAWVESRARFFGALAGVPVAEGFIQREPMLVEDLSRLAGSSF